MSRTLLLAATFGLASCIDAKPAHRPVRVVLCEITCAEATLNLWNGATFVVGPVASASERVSLAGIDSPEAYDKAKCDREKDLAIVARTMVARLLAAGKVRIQRKGLDGNGHTLATVTVSGIDISRSLISAGLARTSRLGQRSDWCAS